MFRFPISRILRSRSKVPPEFSSRRELHTTPPRKGRRGEEAPNLAVRGLLHVPIRTWYGFHQCARRVTRHASGAFHFPPILANPNPPVATRFKPGHPGGPGRPSKMALWQAKVEAEFDEVVKPLYDALEATQSASYLGVVVPSDVPDIAQRVQATREILDRVYGKATQRTEVSGQVDLRALMTGETGDAFTE